MRQGPVWVLANDRKEALKEALAAPALAGIGEE